MCEKTKLTIRYLFQENILQDEWAAIFLIGSQNHSDSVASKAKYNDNVSKMVQLFEDVFIDSFKISDAPTGLVNFATGVIASSETEQSLLNALDTGHEHVSRFINERFVIPEGQTTPDKAYNESLPKCNIKL